MLNEHFEYNDSKTIKHRSLAELPLVALMLPFQLRLPEKKLNSSLFVDFSKTYLV